jgi:hypothetical protein
MSYFVSRHRAGERLKLLQLSGGNADDNAYADFAFHILRQARGLHATAFEGKGASICSRYGAAPGEKLFLVYADGARERLKVTRVSKQVRPGTLVHLPVLPPRDTEGASGVLATADSS